MGTARPFPDFAEISPSTQQVLASLGFVRATPVQDAVIPLFCGHKDVAVDASTGSGKTLAFVIPIVEKFRKLEEPLLKHQVGAIIVSPTRELARQICNVATPFLDTLGSGVKAQLLVGGTDVAEDVANFKDMGAQLLIGTPGRILDVMKRCSTMELKRLEVLVLDEADRLLDMGFRTQLDAIMARLPKQRRTGLFSATQTEAVQSLARAGLRNPVRVNVAVTVSQPASKQGKSSKASSKSASHDEPEAATQKTPVGLQIHYSIMEVDQKLDQLVRFLQLHGTSKKIIVYGLTCACVDFYALALARLGPKLLPGVQIRSLHGKMKQAVREAAMSAFMQLSSGVLLATDLAARGLDIPAVHWVVQVDPPQDPDAFVHRVGRTARAGQTGAALVFLTPNEATYVDFLKVRKIPLAEAPALDGAPNVVPLLRKESEGDRQIMESGMRGFVSYVRGYKEHKCNYIFRIQELDLGRLASSFALLRLPHMPEVKRALMKYQAQGDKVPGSLEHFAPSPVEPDSVKYKDKTREKQRQKMLKDKAATAAKEAASPAAVKTPGKGRPVDHTAGERLTATKRRKLQYRDEIAELAAEHSLLKKLKRGEITESEFDKATGLGSSSDEEEDMEVGGQGSDDEGDGTKLQKVKAAEGTSRVERKTAARAKKAQRKAKHKGHGKG